MSDRNLHEAKQLLHAGQRARAKEAFARIVELEPKNAEAWQMLGMIAFEDQQFDQALRYVRRSIELAPLDPHFVHNAGLVYRAAGQLPAAEAALEKSLRLMPNNPNAWSNLGLVVLEQKRPEEAILAFEKALHLDSTLSLTHTNMGLAYSMLGRLDEALNSYRAAAAADKSNAIAYANLGAMYQRLERLDEAIEALQAAVTIDPKLHTGWCNLGTVLTSLKKYQEAATALYHAVELNPESHTNWMNLGIALLGVNQIEEAAACFHRAVEINPEADDAWNNLGTTLKEMGFLAEAADAYRRSIEIKPSAEVHSNLLFCLIYDRDLAYEEVVAEHRVWDAMHGYPVEKIPPHTNVPDPNRRIRVGYFSPDFRLHAVAKFIEPILANHNPELVDVFAYAEVTEPDETTRRLKKLVPRWRWTPKLSDQQLEAQIRDDRIDILIDLASHTGHNRLPALSRKPAPIQALWMGYPGTSGLSSFDYLLTDDGLHPPNETSQEVEQLFRLPCGSACFLPDPLGPEVSVLPAARNGYVTFGSPHNLAKVNKEVLTTWAKILNAVPNARLLMFRAGMKGSVIDSLANRFAKAGGNPQQLELRDVSTGSHGYVGYMTTYQDIDICLDTFPANGGTTTCEALWMGVPWITLAGKRFFGRQTTSVLKRLDLDDWVAKSPAEYVSKAIEKTKRIIDLAPLRSTLRHRFAESTLGNAKKYTAEFELALREMWQRWCSKQTHNGGPPLLPTRHLFDSPTNLRGDRLT